MMDKGTFSDSFLGTASIRIADLFGYSSKIAERASSIASIVIAFPDSFPRTSRL
jgi:hypothetical protein